MGKAIADPLFLFLTSMILIELLLCREWRRLRSLARLAVVLGFVGIAALWLLGTHAAESYFIGKLSGVHPIPSDEEVARIDVVVVLSGGFVDTPISAYDQPDAWTTARVIQGVRTFFDSDARWLVMTGRWTRSDIDVDDGPASEAGRHDAARMAVAMKQLAVDMGVPPERIVVEPNARTTREHPVELLQLGVVEPGDSVGVVTSSWHLPRAVREFEKFFEDVVAVPAFDVAVNQKGGLLRWLPRSMHLESSATALAEYIGMVWYRLSSL